MKKKGIKLDKKSKKKQKIKLFVNKRMKCPICRSKEKKELGLSKNKRYFRYECQLCKGIYRRKVGTKKVFAKDLLEDQMEIARKERELEKKSHPFWKDLMDQAERQLNEGNFDSAIELYKECEKIFSEIFWLEGLKMVQKLIEKIYEQKELLKLKREFEYLLLEAEKQRKERHQHIQVFIYNDRERKYEEITIELDEDITLYNLLNSDNIFLFIDHNHSIAWIWIGSNTSSRMRFISAKIAPSFRDRYGFAYRLKIQDEGNESNDFKIMIGL